MKKNNGRQNFKKNLTPYRLSSVLTAVSRCVSTLMVTVTLVSIGYAETAGISYEVNKDNPFQKSIFTIPKSLSKLIPTDYRKQWSRITGFEFSGLHWGQFVVVYMNDHVNIYKNNYLEYIRIYVEDEDIEEEDKVFQEYPVGTIFLKENYIVENGLPSHPSSLTLMIKREPGYDPKGGDWQYLQSDVKGNMAIDGRMNDKTIFKLCGECHEK